MSITINSAIKCLIDSSFKIYKNWKFHGNRENITSNLTKNAYLLPLVDKVFKKYIDRNQFKDILDVYYLCFHMLAKFRAQLK